MARGDLGSAHRGYIYQDVTTAIALAGVLAARTGTITVDKKSAPGDVFDDITVRGDDGVVRRQIKWSEQGTQTLELDDFVHEKSAVRIDKLIGSFKSDHAANIQKIKYEYRLCVAWLAPTAPALLAALSPTAMLPLVAGVNTRQYTLNVDAIWPTNGSPNWAPLLNGTVTRAEFVSFAKHFVIETDIPPFSSDLSAPGSLEQVLLKFLRERIGIGRYPNESRTVEDVAARLIALASHARSTHLTLTPQEIANVISLRTDDGRVAQKFPVDAEVQVARRQTRDRLRSAIAASRIVTFVGPPGSGKSWELSGLSDELREVGCIVARHYCYLEPGDPEVERRVTTNALFGNLISELLEQAPQLAEAKSQAYASTSDQLEKMLQEAAAKTPDKTIVLIIDGIDHISRVFAESRSLKREDTDIVETLAALSLPNTVHLVFGSQPGPHLDVLSGVATEVAVPLWTESETWVLATRHGIHELLRDHGSESPAVEEAFCARAEGSPLYATFLSRSLRLEFSSGSALDVKEWLHAMPAIGGDIARYYEYIYSTAHLSEQWIADLLGVIDFAVTQEELREIVPAPFRGHVGRGIDRLRPILIEVAGQGGVRIFHESFRRFIVAGMAARRDEPLGEVLQVVVEWLTRLGFFANAKSFRYLLPSLARMGRTDEIFRLTGVSFVKDGIAEGHSRLAIERNLALASDAAATSLRWPELTRYCELYRALHTCYEETLYYPLEYWETFLAVRGPRALEARLLFDGNPTLPKNVGLMLCSKLDDMGLTPPWQEYFRLPDEEQPESYDQRESLSNLSLVLSAKLHARLNLDGCESALDSLQRFLVKNDELDVAIVRALLRRVEREASVTLVDSTIRPVLTPQWEAELLLARAELRWKEGEKDKAAALAREAVVLSPDLEILSQAVRFKPELSGVRFERHDPLSVDIGLDGRLHHIELQQIERWVRSAAVLIHTDSYALARLIDALRGEGWYRAWLRYTVLMLEGERNVLVGETSSASIVMAFQELASDVRPFAGKPHARDISNARSLIRETIERGLDMLNAADDWRTAIECVVRTVHGTSTYIRKTPSGPILRESVAHMLLPYAERTELREILAFAVESQCRQSEEHGEHFRNHADIEFAAARVFAAMKDHRNADMHWETATTYAASYGFRKDATIYQLLGGIPAFRCDRGRAKALLERLQPLVDAVVRHTDGKGTNQSPNSWLRRLAEVDPVAGLTLVAQSHYRQGVGYSSWQVENAAEDALKAVAAQSDDKVDLRLLACAVETLRFRPDYDREAVADAAWRVCVAERMFSRQSPGAQATLRRLAARIEGDCWAEYPAAWGTVAEAAGRVQTPLTTPLFEQTSAKPEETVPEAPLSSGGAEEPLPELPLESSALQIMTAIRAALHGRPGGLNRDALMQLAEYAAPRIVSLATRGDGDSAFRLVRLFARELPWYDGSSGEALARLAKHLKESELHELAATAFSLAFVRSRGGGGWDSFGGDEHVAWLNEARSLHKDVAHRAMATEVAHLLRAQSYLTGITPGLVCRLSEWGESEVAEACWDEAFDVISCRLRSRVAQDGTFVSLPEVVGDGWSLDEALIGFLLGRLMHPTIGSRRAALLALATAVHVRPDAAQRPLVAFFELKFGLTWTCSVLQILCEAEEAPYPISQSIIGSLRDEARSEFLGVRSLACQLLVRLGEELPSGAVVAVSPIQAAHIQDRTRVILALDRSDRMELLSGLVPMFNELVLARLQCEHDANKSSAAHFDYWRSVTGVSQRHPDFWPMIHGGPQELNERAIQATANDVKAMLWASGQGDASLDEKLARVVLPRMRMQLAFEASRGIRPRLPKPTEIAAGATVPLLLDTADEHAGWFRLGFYERQYAYKDSSRFGNPDRIVACCGTGYVTDIGTRPPTDARTPYCDMDAWLEGEREWRMPGGRLNLMGPRGSLSCVSSCKDSLGINQFMLPHFVLLRRFNLERGLFPGPLAWFDSAREPHIIFRAWWVRSLGDKFEDEVAMLAGCDLIVSPVIASKLQEWCASPIQLISDSHEMPVEDWGRK